MCKYLLLDLLAFEGQKGLFKTAIIENDKGEQIPAYLCTVDPTFYFDAETLDSHVLDYIILELLPDSKDLIERLTSFANKLEAENPYGPKNKPEITKGQVEALLKAVLSKDTLYPEDQKSFLGRLLDKIEVKRGDGNKIDINLYITLTGRDEQQEYASQC